MLEKLIEEEYRIQNGLRPTALTEFSNLDALYETLRVACFFAGVHGLAMPKALGCAIRQ